MTNTGTVTGTQTVNSTDFDGGERDRVDVTLDAWESNDTITLNWTTKVGEAGIRNVPVQSVNGSFIEP